jgi:universal stress protein E
MRRIRRILIAVKDPRARSSSAVTKGTQLAIALGAEVELFHALCDPLIVREDDRGEASPARRGRRELEDDRAALERVAGAIRRHGVAVHCHSIWDHPAHEAIVRRALGSHADLVVVERHAGEHRAPWLLSYSDWEVLRLAPCPVLLVKSGRPWHRPGILAAVDPSRAHAKPPQLDAQILEMATALREALKGRLDVVHAVSRPRWIADPGIADGGAAEAAMLLAGAASEAGRNLDALLARMRTGKVGRYLTEGPAAEAIADTARRARTSIVVMGAVSRSGLKRLFIGETAADTLDAVRADVLVVKPGGFAPDLPRRPRGMSVLRLRATVS